MMDKNEIFENYHFVMVKRLRMIVCIWPYQNKTLKFYGQIFIIFAIFSMMIPQSVLILVVCIYAKYGKVWLEFSKIKTLGCNQIKLYEEFYAVDRDVRILTENFAGLIYFIMSLWKIYTSVIHEKKLQYLYETITNDYEQIQEPGERAAMDDLRDFARIVTILYAAFMTATLILFVFTPQVIPAVFDMILPLNETRHKMICYYAEYFIDQDKYLEILVLHTFVVIAISLTLLVAVETTFVVVSYHVLGLYNVLTYRLKQLCNWVDGNVNSDDERLHNFVIDTIKIHTKTLDFAELVRTTYDTSNFVVFGMALLALSIGGVDVLMNLTRPEVILRIGIVFIGVVLQLFFLNWPGQRFLDNSADLVETIYFCNWYKLPVRTQFLLRFMMMRCTMPCQLTAGPLFQMNFEFCGNILRKSLSFLMAAYSLS